MVEQNENTASESLQYELIALTRRIRCSRPAPTPSMEGLSTMELHALMMLVRADERQVSVKPSDIARRFHVSPSAVSQFLKNLEQKGFIARTRAKADSRSVEICLTEKGTAFSSQLRKERDDEFSRMVEAIGVEETKQFVATLGKICDYLDASDAFVSLPQGHPFAGKDAPCA